MLSLSNAFILSLSMDPAPAKRDFTSNFKNIKVFNGRTTNIKKVEEGHQTSAFFSIPSGFEPSRLKAEPLAKCRLGGICILPGVPYKLRTGSGNHKPTPCFCLLTPGRIRTKRIKYQTLLSCPQFMSS